jgi:uncharacterized protein YciW
VIADPHEVAARWPDARLRAISELTIVVTSSPWSLTRDHLHRAYSANLSDEDVLHLVCLSSYFGHLNRIADVVGIPLDYDVSLDVPAPDPAAQVWQSAPKVLSGRPAIDPARRPATHAALADWKSYIFMRDEPLSRRSRTLLARWVATFLGDGTISSPTDLTVNPHDDLLRVFAEQVTLAPWTVDDDALAPLRAAGFDDTKIFDAAATITSAGVFSRIEVALAALAT